MAWLDQLTRGVRGYVLLALIVIAAATPGLVSMPVLDRDEARFSQASAQMLETGDFVVIRYHDDLRNKKPVGIHWMQTAVVAALSSAEAREIAYFRLPSLIGAVIAAWATLWAGAALVSRRVGFLGAGLLSLTLLLTSEAHIAKTDGALVGSVMLMVAALAQMREDHRKGRSRRLLGVLFWAALGAGVLLKGVISPMIAGFILLGLFAWERKAAWMRPLAFWPGLTVFSVMVIPWFVAVQIATEGEFLFEAARVDLGQKLVQGAEGHAGPPGVHLLALPLLFWPASLFLPAALVLAWVNGVKAWKRTPEVEAPPEEARLRDAWRFLLVWAVPAWAVFEIAPTKLVHYTLPIYPALALMCGIACERWLSGEARKTPHWVGIGVFAVASVLLAAAASPPVLAAIRADAAAEFGAEMQERIAFFWSRDWRLSGPGWWATIAIIGVAAGVVFASVRGRRAAALGGLVAASFVAGWLYRAVLLPNQSWMLATPAAIETLAEVCGLPEGAARDKAAARAGADGGCTSPAPRIVRAVGFAEPSFVFALGGAVTLPPASTTDLPPASEEARPVWVVNVASEDGRDGLNRIIEQAAAGDRCVRLARRTAFNYSNGDPSLLVGVAVEPGGCGDVQTARSTAEG
ncbi:phospholipid carrier-dependent glycosyltransferase [bacterium]|nr:phospholipid carrier-dependent glycosyltransferase [bacterium]